MPFDGREAAPAAIAAETPAALYRARREAAAALWRAVPPELFRMEFFFKPDIGAGCALGHLGAVGHDGWALSFSANRPVWGAGGGSNPWIDAEAYFGLRLGRSLDLFGYEPATAEEVSRRLLAEPVLLTGRDRWRTFAHNLFRPFRRFAA